MSVPTSPLYRRVLARDHFDGDGCQFPAPGHLVPACDQANGMLLDRADFAMLQECVLPLGHSRRRLHRNSRDDVRWRQPDLEGLALEQAKYLRVVLDETIKHGLTIPGWALDYEVRD